MKHSAQLLLLFSSFAHGGEPTMLTDLNSLQWKNRIVVVNNIQNEDEVVTLFWTKSAAINDREIVWFVIKGDNILSNYSGKLAKDFLRSIRKKYIPGQGETILIGKDGRLKSRFNSVELQAIFSDIDAMPMRQREMQD